MRRRVFVAALIPCLAVVCLAGCSSSRTSRSSSNSATANSATAPAGEDHSTGKAAVASALFKDVARPAGLSFKHILGDTGRFYFVEFTAPGCAFFDYNNDDYLDIFLVQSGSVAPPTSVRQRPFCALYRNNRDGTFTDVTPGSGLDKDLGYGQGVAVGDYDNDGSDDLFITAYGGNHLFRNRGNGKFEDVTQSVGLARVHGTGYATSAAWGDYDSDGRLDLYVCYYSLWSHAANKECRDKQTGLLDYCHPQLYDPMTHRLYHNTGNCFVDVSEQAGITQDKGRGLAAAWIDFNRDARPDIFVANDVTPTMLWRNNGNGTFTNVANEMGCAYDGEGKGIAGMGLAVADYDRSGRESIYVSNFSSRPNILFKNEGETFEDVTGQAHLAFSHLKFLSFGCEFFDYDADGWSDLIVNNGHVQVRENKREAGVPQKQRKQLLHNEGRGIFREITEEALLGDLSNPVLGRGLAVGDYDNDGHPDVLAVAQNAPAQLLHNQVVNGNHWIAFKTIGIRSNRDGVHARFGITAAGVRQTATVRGGSSYLSASDRRVYFGLGAAAKIDQVVVQWPSGARDVLKNLPADTFYTVTEGRGVTRRQNPK
ncbi:MAG: CRTAC1 family protein [Armatimonadota bacterium]|nr:CRTAC1 family protein [Armatimonadota bacterium]